MRRPQFVSALFLLLTILGIEPALANCGGGNPNCLAVSVTPATASALFGSTVTFTSVVSGGTPPYTFNWSVADASHHTAPGIPQYLNGGSSFEFTFQAAGFWYVTFTATDETGYYYGTTQATVSVGGLIASASSSASVAVVGDPIQFACTSSFGAGAVSYRWTVTDGFQTSAQNFTHSFSTPGSFTATCVATDSIAQRAGSNVVVLIDPAATIYFPAAASIHGNAGTFFHTDAWLTNHSSTQPVALTATYYCFVGTGCNGVSRPLVLAPRETRLVSDIVATLLGAPESAGPIQFTYDSTEGPVTALARVYSPALPAPTYGGAFAAVPLSQAQTWSFFAGLGSSGGNLSTGFRSNAGIFNPGPGAATVTLTLYDATGVQAGSPVTLSVSPNTAQQVNDVFAATGLASTVTLDHVLIVTSSSPVFPYVTVIDNQSGDFVYIPSASD